VIAQFFLERPFPTICHRDRRNPLILAPLNPLNSRAVPPRPKVPLFLQECDKILRLYGWKNSRLKSRLWPPHRFLCLLLTDLALPPFPVSAGVQINPSVETVAVRLAEWQRRLCNLLFLISLGVLPFFLNFPFLIFELFVANITGPPFPPLTPLFVPFFFSCF